MVSYINMVPFGIFGIPRAFGNNHLFSLKAFYKIKRECPTAKVPPGILDQSSLHINIARKDENRNLFIKMV